MKKIGLPILGAVVLTTVFSTSFGQDAKANQQNGNATNKQFTETQVNHQEKNSAAPSKPDTKYWNKEVESNGDEVYTITDAGLYKELRDKNEVKKDPKFESMLQERASGGVNKYVVHKNGTSTIYLSNKWASRVAAGDVALVASLVGAGPYAALLSPLIAGAIGDKIPKNGLKIDVLLGPSPVVKGVSAQ